LTYIGERRGGGAGRCYVLLLLLGVFLAVACRDDLNAPVDCPALCPGGQPPVLESVLIARDSMDSSFVGYVPAGLGISLRVSNGLPVSEDRGIVQFLPLPDTVVVSDSGHHYVIDSVEFGLTLQARDTLVDSLRFLLYRLPIGIDTTTTFADIAPNLVPGNVVDTIFVPDSVKSGVIQSVLSGAELTRVLIPPGDSGKIAIAIALVGSAPTGARIASIAATGSPRMKTYVTADSVADSTKKQVSISRFPSFASFVSQAPLALNNDLLSIGGAPSHRARLKFDLPRNLRDSVTILRATLELTPNSTILGLPNDPATLQAIGVIGDLGAKSPLVTGGNTIGLKTVDAGTTGTVEIDVTRLIRAWQTKNGLPTIVFIAIAPEAATFTQPVFKSTRSGSGAPQLRITYYDKFPFQRF